MKVLLKASSLLLALLIVCAAFTGCHAKNETAITIGEIKIKSSTYSCALTQAYQEAVSKVEEQESDSSEHNHTDGYMKEKIDKKSFGDWVKDRAKEICKEYAAVYTLAKTEKITLSDDELSQISQTASYYWTSYGLEDLYGNLGVSQDTYEGFLGYSSLKEKVFTTLYGENGSKAVDTNEVTNTIYTEHNTAEVLQKNFSDSTDQSSDDIKSQYQAYVDRINAGESFKTIYCEANNTTEEELDEQMASYSSSDSEQPANRLEQVIGAEGTDYESELFDTVKGLEVGKATLYSNDTYCAVVVKTDITKDEYYKTALNSSALRYLKGDEFDELIKDTYKALDFKESKYATSRFKVKDVNKQYLEVQKKNASQQTTNQ